MKKEAEQVLCRFHLSSLARHGVQPLYEWIAETAHRAPRRSRRKAGLVTLEAVRVLKYVGGGR
jgi:hypothetical protein